MICEYAIEPDVVASWHDRAVWYPLSVQLGLGTPRVACAFPARDWRKLVEEAFDARIANLEGAARQQARAQFTALMQWLLQYSTRRKGAISPGQGWVSAALQEHRVHPFGGIVAHHAPPGASGDVIVPASLPASPHPAWSRASPPVQRTAKELATALAPMLRSATEIRFVDQYFDADVQEYMNAMEAYLAAAQTRRDRVGLRVEIHFGIRPGDVEAARRRGVANPSVAGVARDRVVVCEKRIKPLLHGGVTVAVCAWGAAPNKELFHNRYVLSDIGGVAVLHGLDEAAPGKVQLDDLTILTADQYRERWQRHCAQSNEYHLLVSKVIG